MNADKIKRMLDACYVAKRIMELLPELPDGVTPAYIQYMDVIHKLESSNKKVKVSDISATLNLPRPGVQEPLRKWRQKVILQSRHRMKMEE